MVSHSTPLAKLVAHVRDMDREELLDRVTVFREAMEATAIEIMEAELARRGVGPEAIRLHQRQHAARVFRDSNGLPAQCSICLRAAVVQRTGWHKFWKILPVVRRTVYYCERHAAENTTA